MDVEMQRRGRPIEAAFTLIEVLVVVSIIALLIAILMPSLSKAREQAKRVLCASNHHQMNLALQMYSTDQAGYAPPSVKDFNASLTWIVYQTFSDKHNPPYPIGWIHLGVLFQKKMMPDQRAYYCPSYTEFPHVYPKGWYEFSAGSGGIERVATSYMYAISGQVDAVYPKSKYPNGPPSIVKLASLKRSALFTDIFISNGSKYQKKGIWPHFGGINVSYADGSTQLVRVKSEYAKQAVDLYNYGSMTDKDYFTWAFFRMLSKDSKWIDAFPKVPPGAVP
jgi:prepilin-type N-terminal cleavage/methylation domain-containing protein